MSFRGEIFICNRPGGQVPMTTPTQNKNRRKQEIKAEKMQPILFLYID